MISKNMLLKNI